MAQIQDSCFRVLSVNDEDLDLIDLHRGRGHIVSVERRHDMYSSDIESQIDSLRPGNCIKALLQSEDIYRPDGIWRFLEFTRFEETELHALKVDNIRAQDMLLMEGAFENGQSSPELIKSEGEVLGYKIGISDSRGGEAYGPVVTTYDEIYDTLGRYDEPPYEIISITEDGVPLEIRYYLKEKDTDIASRIIDAGEYLLGHKRE